MGEVLTLELAIRRRAAARVLGQTFVFTNGCFDLIHPGHVALLKEAREQGHYLMVGINSDRSVRALKGEGRPAQNEADRAAVLAAMRDVEGVVVFDEETPAKLIEALLPDVLVKGGDYTPDQVVGRDVVERAGGRVHIVPLVPGKSSSALAGKP
ncbi:MAG TPA: D-glycero-beta-D-manno-heptose 1-phosphate adenylyltransferase [Candidatus Eisenbacteria bacterium]|nr:D-glycero-beta-D-manno-heptose 1-phosphate adenylyltransferase [Candidatus Eisenbacteria bacterium]